MTLVLEAGRWLEQILDSEEVEEYVLLYRLHGQGD